MWLAAEEESFGRTLAQGMETLGAHIERARAAGESTIAAEEVFRLHDTYGFPYEMTSELLGEQGLGDRGRLRGADGGAARARARGRARAARWTPGAARASARAPSPARAAPRRASPAMRPRSSRRRSAARLADGVAGSRRRRRTARRGALPGQARRVAVLRARRRPGRRRGTIECERRRLPRAGRGRRSGSATTRRWPCVVEEGELHAGERGARARRPPRRATRPSATTRPRTCCTRRCASASAAHVRQAGSYVGPDKLRFDFSHGQGLSAQELRDVEDRVNEWIARNDPVRPITTTLDEARRLGAMALFGEKYGDVVRMVEIGEGEYSRELCGGTHVRSTAEIGVFRILSETSSAANVRRIEAVTGPAAVDAAARARPRCSARSPRRCARARRTRPRPLRRSSRERKRLEKQLRQGARRRRRRHRRRRAGGPGRARSTARACSTARCRPPTPRRCSSVLDRVKGRLGDAAILLGTVARRARAPRRRASRRRSSSAA